MSDKSVGDDIKRHMAAGKSYKQALAIALRERNRRKLLGEAVDQRIKRGGLSTSHEGERPMAQLTAEQIAKIKKAAAKDAAARKAHKEKIAKEMTKAGQLKKHADDLAKALEDREKRSGKPSGPKGIITPSGKPYEPPPPFDLQGELDRKTKADEDLKKRAADKGESVLEHFNKPTSGKPIPGKKRVSIDRFEGDSKETAVLIDEDGTPYLRPRSALPPGAKAGDVLKHDLSHDPEATKAVHDQTRDIQKSLRKRDPGGNIQILKPHTHRRLTPAQRSAVERGTDGRWITVHGHHIWIKNK